MNVTLLASNLTGRQRSLHSKISYRTRLRTIERINVKPAVAYSKALCANLCVGSTARYANIHSKIKLGFLIIHQSMRQERLSSFYTPISPYAHLSVALGECALLPCPLTTHTPRTWWFTCMVNTVLCFCVWRGCYHFGTGQWTHTTRTLSLNRHKERLPSSPLEPSSFNLNVCLSLSIMSRVVRLIY